MSEDTKQITLGIRVTFTFPKSQTPRSVEGWWLDEGPAFEEWLSCTDKDVIVDDILVDDYHVASPGVVNVYYRIEAHYPARWRRDDAGDAVLDAVEFTELSDDWNVGEVKPTGVKFYD
jgi:hypothetical protein